MKYLSALMCLYLVGCCDDISYPEVIDKAREQCHNVTGTEVAYVVSSYKYNGYVQYTAQCSLGTAIQSAVKVD